MASTDGSVNGFLKVTEQGEQISSKYLNEELAKYNFTQTLSATLKRSVYDKFEIKSKYHNNTKYIALMEKISEASMKKYRKLVYETDGFIKYFKQATPIHFISKLNIGSRPSKRKATNSIEDLRAIPWVFSWTQNRSILTAWYGVGSGIAHVADQDNGTTDLLECYKSYPFFRNFIDNLAMALMKTNINIAKMYSGFVNDKKLESTIWNMIEQEFNQSMKIYYIFKRRI